MEAPIRLIVAGSRNIRRYGLFRKLMDTFLAEFADRQVILITGRAGSGPDDMIYHYALWDRGYEIEQYEADWDTHGKRAGIMRNITMGDVATDLLDFWNGDSPGSKHMIEYAKKIGLTTTVVVLDDDPDGIEGELITFNSSRRL